MKRTFTSHYKWGDSNRNKLIANMLAQGYSEVSEGAADCW